MNKSSFNNFFSVGKILIGCEYSQTVMAAFYEAGFNAYSCDVLPTEGKYPERHIQDDLFNVIKDDWTLAIFHPPCTYLSYAGMANWYDDGRAMKRIKAAEFFMKCYDAEIPHICVENPRGIMTKIFRKADQEVHPYYFGEREMKRTQLWLKNLPALEYHLEDNLFGKKTATEKPEPIEIQVRKKTGQIKKRYWTDSLTNGNYLNGKKKSKFFESIANAMAEQWGNFLISESVGKKIIKTEIER